MNASLEKHGIFRRNLFVWLFLAPSLIIFLLYRIIPLVWNAVLSLQFWSLYAPPEFAGLYHYNEMLFHDDIFWQSLQNTAILVASAPVGITIALAIAVLIDRKIRGGNIYKTIIFLSYPLMPVAVGIIWQWLYDENVGLFNHILISLGIMEKGIPFLESFNFALPAVIVASIWQVLGLYMIILLAGMQSISSNIYEAAMIDGASPWNRFRKITLPLLRPSIFLCLIVGLVNSFSNFDLIFVMTDGGPAYATEILVTYIYRTAFKLSHLDYAGALTVVNFVLFMILAWVANRLFGGAAGTIKSV